MTTVQAPHSSSLQPILTPVRRSRSRSKSASISPSSGSPETGCPLTINSIILATIKLPPIRWHAARLFPIPLKGARPPGADGIQPTPGAGWCEISWLSASNPLPERQVLRCWASRPDGDADAFDAIARALQPGGQVKDRQRHALRPHDARESRGVAFLPHGHVKTDQNFVIFGDRTSTRLTSS